MKLRYKGKIKELNHIIISDPSYDESVTCRYEKNNLKEKNWYVDIDIKPTVDKIEDFTSGVIACFISTGSPTGS